MTFNDLTNKILQEQYFGGSPYEQSTGIKKHVTVTEDDEDTEMMAALKDDLGGLDEYGYGDKSGNPERQSQEDEIIEMFFDLTTLKKVGEYQGIIGKTHVYTVDDDDIKEAMGDYTKVAYSRDDLGDEPDLFPLDKWYSVIIGKPIANASGMNDNVPKLGNVILHDNPEDAGEKLGMGPRIDMKTKVYDGPAIDIKSLSNKEDSASDIGPSAPNPGKLDVDKVRNDVEWARKRGLMG